MRVTDVAGSTEGVGVGGIARTLSRCGGEYDAQKYDFVDHGIMIIVNNAQ